MVSGNCGCSYIMHIMVAHGWKESGPEENSALCSLELHDLVQQPTKNAVSINKEVEDQLLK